MKGNTNRARIPTSAKTHTDNSDGKVKKGYYEVQLGKDQIDSSVESTQKLGDDYKMEGTRSASSTVRVSKNEPKNLEKKTVRVVKKNAKQDLQTSSKFRTSKARKKAHKYSRSFRFTDASMKLFKRFPFGRFHTREGAKSMSETIPESSRMISKKAESARRKRKFESNKTLAERVRTSIRHASKKRAVKSIGKKGINGAVRALNTATMPLRQATKLATSTLRTDADDDDDLKHQKLHYEYTIEYKASSAERAAPTPPPSPRPRSAWASHSVLA